ncbi:hypothetical protein [Actinomarinicola tropica]|uniref:Uncharacterized protein n=1 Tax=Actinomarinicola tropica TaxID=2789776 RepID=A0A5Q2RFJ1_9ACTN|nr:hypothetical protein [Actinomarinicola tropica]QGG94463.1 hypothetical protein GH723_04730 [Actinomarinicola tropica]
MSHVAASDCERIRDGRVAQPANTASSLAFVVAGVEILRRTGRHRRWWSAVAAASITAGIGSVAYHGPGGRIAKVVHDVGVDALALALPVAVAADGAPARISPRTVALGAASVAAHVLTRTGAPLCDPDARVQGHAVFHVLAASAVASAARDQLARPPA